MENYLSLVRNYAVGSAEAEILLYNAIDKGSADEFVAAFRYLEAAGVSLIRVRINSPGGSVLHGYPIVSAIENSSVEVHTHNDGVAASMAAVIFQMGKKRVMYDYSLLMLHTTSVPDGIELNENLISSLAAMKQSLATIMSNKSGKELDYVLSTWMEEGVDNWFSAADAVSNGLADEVVTTGKKSIVDISATASIEQIYNSFHQILQTPMSFKLIANAFGMATITSEEDVVAKINTLKNENTALATDKATLEATLTANKDQIADLEKTVNDYKQKEALEQEARCVKLVEDAFTAKRISGTEEVKNTWLTLARNNFEATEKAITKLPVRAKLTDFTQVEDKAAEPAFTSPFYKRMEEIRNKAK